MITFFKPQPNPTDSYFWEGVERGEFLLQRCAECKALRHPPSPMCAACGSTAAEAVPAAGTGTVASWIVSTHPSQSAADGRLVVLVELDEGVRVVSNMDRSASVQIGMPVELTFRKVDGVTLPHFQPVNEGKSR